MPKGGSRINAGRKIKLEEKLEFTKRLTKTENDFILFARDKKIDLAKLKKNSACFCNSLFYVHAG